MNGCCAWSVLTLRIKSAAIGFGLLSMAFTAQAQTNILPPIAIQAADGVYTNFVRLTWQASPDVPPADGCQLWRAISNQLGMASVVVDYIDVTNTYVDDVTVAPSVHYYYWMKSYQWVGTSRWFSSFSGSDAGFAQPTANPPPSLTCINFNNGELASGVVTLRWSTVGMSESDFVRIEYSSYQGFSFNTLAVNVPAMSGVWVWDTSLLPDTTQAIWRISSLTYSNVVDACDRTFSVMNPHVAPPGWISASSGTYTGQIVVAWGSSALAQGYYIYRASSMNSAAAVLVGATNGTVFTDAPMASGSSYWYWIKAWRYVGTNLEVSTFSSAANGSSRYPRYVSAPHEVSASDGTYTGQVQVTWHYPTNCLGAAVYRSTNASSASAVLIGTVEMGWWYWQGEYCDTSAVAGVVYYYWVKTRDYDYDGSSIVYSVFSSPDSGYAANVPPTALLTASPTNGCAPLRVTLDSSGSYDVDGGVARVEFDREGDGTYESSLDAPGEIVVEYASAGVYHPAIRVTDNLGAQATASASVTVWGEGPTAILEASPTSGAAPLSVTFKATNSMAAAGRWIAVYEWDVDGDGSYERVTTNALFSWVYGAAGTNTARLRVTDNQGLQDVAFQTIVVSPAANPPVVSLSVDSQQGTIPLTVIFTAQLTSGGPVAAYQWDFNGDGAYDLSTATHIVSHTYTEAGAYQASVTAVDGAGLSGVDSVAITASVAQGLKVWISTPKDGAVLWGESVSLRAQTAPGNRTQAVRFEYKREDAETWTVLGGYIYPPPYSFSAAWNVTGLSDGYNYQLRARALDTAANEIVSDSITVIVDSGNATAVGAIVEGFVGGKQQKNQVFSKDETTFVGVSDGTQIVVPAGTVDSNSSIRVVLTGLNTNAPGGSAAGKASINANRHISIEGDPSLAKPIVIVIPYDDVDNDGIVDGTGVPEMTLTAHWYDTSSGQWRRALSTEVYPDENYLKATTYHLTEFGLFGNKNLLHPANGSVLELYTSERSATNGVQNLTDDNTVSYWQSAVNPSQPQEMVYSFKDDQSALIAGAGIYNHGSGSTGYSRAFQVLGSIDGTTYSVLTNGLLVPTLDAQIFNFGSVTCRHVKLVVADGVNAAAWELAEFELYGDLTPDADDDTLTDAWEVNYFGNLASNNATNDADGDGLQNGDELSAGANPTVTDTDGDGMKDGDEIVAGTSAVNAGDCFVVSDLIVYPGASGNKLGNPGFDIGWNPADSVPYWSHNIPQGNVGGSWGDVSLVSDNTGSGTNIAAIRNLGSHAIGAWWQQVPSSHAPGTVWSASAWVRKEGAYTNARCEMKMEFLDAQTNGLDVVFHNFSAPGLEWQQVSGLATAPVGTANIRFVMAAVGQGTTGSFQFDDVSLEPVMQSSWVIKWNSAAGRLYKVYKGDRIGENLNLIHQVPGTGSEISYTNHVLSGIQGIMSVTVQQE